MSVEHRVMDGRGRTGGEERRWKGRWKGQLGARGMPWWAHRVSE